MWFSKKITLDEVCKAFINRNEILIDSLVSVAETALKSGAFGLDASDHDEIEPTLLKIIRIEASVYTFCFADLLLYTHKINNPKREKIMDYLLEMFSESNNLTEEEFDLFVQSRQSIFINRVRSSDDHVGENLQDLFERIFYALENGTMCKTGIALNGNPILACALFDSFVTHYTESLKGNGLHELLERFAVR